VLGETASNTTSFLVAGQMQGKEYYITEDRLWRLDQDAAWTPVLAPGQGGSDQGAVENLLDSHTAFVLLDFWNERDGQWHRTGYPGEIHTYAGVRLADGLLMSGFPPPRTHRPLGLLVASGEGPWMHARCSRS